ncbi:hypothetical protein [Flavobacterium geliluteum]|uniref:Uncharacterized protein n=1 Tax=Flavobacterium geliluteum TaxID=2816120 RepID=A0A940XBW7_9FLAO|nr:hypothetical protein [Flavobacterium geliluteum]MBP4139161.1 hypothetical protein [Flavobacterium geliluteum]
METNRATIRREEQNTHLILQVNTEEFEIILTDDNPNNVKDVFNKLLKELKNGLFQFKLEDETEDLYHNICKEYLIQLNSEISSVFKELEDYELLEDLL